MRHYLVHTVIVANGNNLHELIEARTPITGDSTILYRGKYETVGCYAGGIILSEHKTIKSIDNLITISEAHDNWEVLFNEEAARVVFKQDNNFFLVTEKSKELFYTAGDKVTTWGLNDLGLLLHNNEEHTLSCVEFATRKETVLYQSETPFRWEAGWDGAIIDADNEIFYLGPEHKATLIEKTDGKYVDWCINRSSPTPTILVETDDMLNYIKHIPDEDIQQHNMGNNYEDFMPCKEGALLYYQGMWRYKPHNGSATELPLLMDKDMIASPHPLGIVVQKTSALLLIFL